MNRNPIHDIKPSVKLRRKQISRDTEVDEELEFVSKKIKDRKKVYNDPYAAYEKKSEGGKGIWYVAVLCIILLVLALSFIFSGATVTVTPRVGNLDVNKLITAKQKPLDNKSLSFEMVTLEGEESVLVFGDNIEKKQVEERATGTVRIFNKNPSTQNLLIDTRLESPAGKIYKTMKAVTVPAQKIEGGVTAPGFIDVDIYADEPGGDYNIPESDFKIVGFKGGAKYETVYARSISEISGGFIGESYLLPESEEGDQADVLVLKLKNSLLEKVKAELPPGFIIFDKAVIFETEKIEVLPPTANKEILIKQKGTLFAFVFKKENLTRNLVNDVIVDFDESIVYISDLEKMSLEVMSISEINPRTVDTINISVKDTINIVWGVDNDQIKDSLLGVNKRKFENILSSFKNIDRAELSLKPFWRNTIPEKKDQIKIINTLEI